MSGSKSSAPDPASERRDHRFDLVAAEHLVEARLLDVEDLALDRQDRLESPVPALLCRAAGRLALDDVDFAERRIAFLAVGEFAGKAAAVERALAPDQIAGLACRLASPRRIDGLADHALGDRRVFLEVSPQPVVEDGLDDALDLGVAKLRLGLPLELRPRNLDADDRGQALADVVAADARVLEVLREIVLAGVEIDRPRQRRTEARKVRAAFVRVDVVREGVDRFGVAVVPLESDLDVDALPVAAHVDWLVVDDRLVLIQVADKRVDPAFVQEFVALPAVALVVNRDRHAAVEEGELAQPLCERVEAQLHGFEDLRVGPERDFRAALLGRARDLEAARRVAALVRLLVDLAVAPDLEIEGFRQRVDDRDADAVETTRDLVAVVVELAAGVEHGQHDFGGGSATRMLVDRNAAAVVDHRHGIIDVERDVDLIAVAGQRFVDRIVDDLVDQVMEARRTGRTDVHRRPFANSLQPLEDFDLVRAVVVGRRPAGAIAVAVAGGRRHAFSSGLRPIGKLLIVFL